MRRLIANCNALLLGMILGMIFVAVVHAPQSHRQAEVHAGRITIGYEILGAKNQTTVLLFAGTAEMPASLLPQEPGSAPSVRPITAAAMQLPTTFIIVRPISISVSTPRISRMGAVGK